MELSEIKRERSLGYSDHSDHSRLECNTCLDNLPASFIFKMDSFLEYFIWEHLMTTSVKEKLPEESLIKVEIAEELKDTCWLEERISESEIRSLKENQSWDVYECSLAREEVGKYLIKIEFNLADFGLFLILQPKLLPRVIKALKLIKKMPYMDYLSFLRTPDGFEWSRLRDQLWPFLIEDGGMCNIQNGENWDL